MLVIKGWLNGVKRHLNTDDVDEVEKFQEDMDYTEYITETCICEQLIQNRKPVVSLPKYRIVGKCRFDGSCYKWTVVLCKKIFLGGTNVLHLGSWAYVVPSWVQRNKTE